MLPRVKINYENGALGQVVAMADGCIGMLALGAKEVASTFVLGTAYMLKKFSDLTELGVTSENNPLLFRQVKDFYSSATTGTELWLLGLADSVTFTTAFDKDAVSAGAKELILRSNGKLRGIVAFKAPASDYSPKLTAGIDQDVFSALAKAQVLADWATEDKYAPIFIMIEGYAFSGDVSKLIDLHTMKHNRCAVLIGDTVKGSKNAAIGLVAGRIASCPVQRKISRVRDGALPAIEVFAGEKGIDVADIESINDKGYITFRTFTGRSGYFVADDPLATAISDDYSSLTNRRVIDKAYRIAYDVLIERLNEEIPISTDGNLTPAWCASLKGQVEQAIISQMTANGNLGNDTADFDDGGVKCSIDFRQKVLATSKIEVVLKIKPAGYAKYIDVKLGFKTV